MTEKVVVIHCHLMFSPLIVRWQNQPDFQIPNRLQSITSTVTGNGAPSKWTVDTIPIIMVFLGQIHIQWMSQNHTFQVKWWWNPPISSDRETFPSCNGPMSAEWCYSKCLPFDAGSFPESDVSEQNLA